MCLALLPWTVLANPQAAPPDAGVASVPGEPPAGAPAETFDILEYAVEGNTVLPAIAIERAVYPHLGEKKTVQDVNRAREALEKAYHDGGYPTVFVDIPEQDVNAGVVRLNVTEGRVERLKVSGSRYYSLGRIKATTTEMGEGNVPYFPEAQKQLAVVSRTPDRRITPVLRPGRSPGKLEVELKVADKLPLHGSVELNTRQSLNTTRTRMLASMRYDNLWQREHSISLLYQTSPEKPSESNVYSLNYVIPRENGDYFAMYVVDSSSDTNAVGDVNVIGKGRIYGLRYIRPLRSLNGFFHNVTFGVDHKDFDDTVTLLGADSFNVPITYTPMQIGYEANWQSEPRSTQAGATMHFSMRRMGNQDAEFSAKRSNASASYAYLRYNLKHAERFGNGYSVVGRLAGQMAGAPLISNEQFAIGGVDTVRGYYESEALGDVGLAASLELRTPPFSRDSASFFNQTYALGFLDFGRVRVLEPQADQRATFHLSSGGLGLRMKTAQGLTLDVDLASPFRATTNTKARDPRLHARLSYEF